MNELHLFAGAGGGILAGQLLGHRCICAVELEPYAQAVLVARQNDGTFPPFPIWDDIRTFDGKPWRGLVDLVAGGFPCQDVSAAGTGEGLDGERSGLWAHMARIIREVRPQRVEVENSPMLTSRGLGRVLGDLAEMGFDAEYGVLSAADTGAPHLRERIWILANARRGRCGESHGRQVEQPRRAEIERGSEALADTDKERRDGRAGEQWEGWRVELEDRGENVAYAVREREQGIIASSVSSKDWKEPRERSYRPRSYGFRRWPVEPGMGRVVDGLANRSHRIKALGNGQVSRVAAAAYVVLSR